MLTTPLARSARDATPGGHAPRRIQLRCACGARAAKDGACDECRSRKRVQRHGPAGSGGPVERGAGSAGPVVAHGAGAHVDAVLTRRGAPLDGATRRQMERSFGHDFSQVRVHTDHAAAASAQALGAQAYATGDHVVFGAGRYAPQTRRGLWLLAHELAHTVQQKLGGDTAQARADSAAPEHDPSEDSADRAADAVLAGAPTPRLHAASGGLHLYRITKVDKLADDERLVHLDSGLRYRVRRGSEFEIREKLVNWADFSPGADRQRVWLQLEWCANKNKGSVRLSADVPDQVAKALVGAVTQGKDVKQILKDARITPRVDVKLLQSGDFSLSANGEVTLDLDGNPTGFSGGAQLSRGPFDFGVKVGPGKGPDDKPQGVQGTINVTITPGRKDKKDDCRREKRSVVEIPHFNCETERDKPAKDIPDQVPVRDQELRYLYFDYAKDSIDRGRSATELAALKTNLADGFKVTNIAGFTSPEGPMDAGPGFIGNIRLAGQRAEAAARQAQADCPQRKADDAKANPTAGACFIAGAQAKGADDPELYTKVVVDENGKVIEAAGAPLAEAAVAGFQQGAAEERHRTPELEQALDKQPTPAGKARLVYPLLRRAVVTLVRNRVVPITRHVEASVQTDAATCPQDVIEAAFGAGATQERTLKDQ